jgi:hypothetical protein
MFCAHSSHFSPSGAGADFTYEHDGQRMCSFLTLSFQLVDAPMQVAMAVPHGCGKSGLDLGDTVSQAPDFIIPNMFYEQPSAIPETVLHGTKIHIASQIVLATKPNTTIQFERTDHLETN